MRLSCVESRPEFCTQSLFHEVDGNIIAPPDAVESRVQRDELVEKPNKIYGLRKAYELGQWYGVSRPDGPQSPCDDLNGAVRRIPLYPFLVVRDAPDNQTGGDMEVGAEAASTIRRLLRLRDDQLQGARAVENADFDVAPLIWLISRWGAQWSLHAGYVEKMKSNAQCVSTHKSSDRLHRS